MARSRSSHRWIEAHEKDSYVQQAREAGFRSRAVYKLAEIDQRDHLLKPGMTVVDLGAAPGGWSQYAAGRVGPQGMVFALDILPMDPLAGVEFLQGDFQQESVLDELLALLGKRTVGLVISDMAPNMSGIRAVDQPRSMGLSELALDLAHQVLAPGGALLIKVFQGEGIEALTRALRDSFQRVQVRKPQASRAHSRELYLLARGYGV